MSKPARTCVHVKTNGIRCGSPALRDSVKCYFHHRHRRRLKRQAVAFTLATRGGRLAALEQVIHAVLTDRMDPEVARSVLYGIHLGSTSKINSMK